VRLDRREEPRHPGNPRVLHSIGILLPQPFQKALSAQSLKSRRSYQLPRKQSRRLNETAPKSLLRLLGQQVLEHCGLRKPRPMRPCGLVLRSEEKRGRYQPGFYMAKPVGGWHERESIRQHRQRPRLVQPTTVVLASPRLPSKISLGGIATCSRTPVSLHYEN
jgi:hypothetical protein